MDFRSVFLVGLGGACGSILRYLVSFFCTRLGILSGLPLGTILVNALGSFLIGLFSGIFIAKQSPNTVILFVLTGVLGGFTTFSTFSLESVQLLKTQGLSLAAINVFGQVALGLSLAYLGLRISSSGLIAS
ncbi:MAG: fluoride efflux transporter CrcB [Deltaproteobacteria bacterium]|nr:fluoride efflux transporter CrcB [Deltaproteobacteria bacterium]